MKGLGFACLANTRRASRTTPSRSSSHIPQFENMPSVNVTYSARIAKKKGLNMSPIDWNQHANSKGHEFRAPPMTPMSTIRIAPVLGYILSESHSFIMIHVRASCGCGSTRYYPCVSQLPRTPTCTACDVVDNDSPDEWGFLCFSSSVAFAHAGTRMF